MPQYKAWQDAPFSREEEELEDKLTDIVCDVDFEAPQWLAAAISIEVLSLMANELTDVERAHLKQAEQAFYAAAPGDHDRHSRMLSDEYNRLCDQTDGLTSFRQGSSFWLLSMAFDKSVDLDTDILEYLYPHLLAIGATANDVSIVFAHYLQDDGISLDRSNRLSNGETWKPMLATELSL